MLNSVRALLHKGMSEPSEIPSFLIDKTWEHYLRRNYRDLVHDSTELRSLAKHCWDLPDSVGQIDPTVTDELAPGKDTIPIRNTQNYEFRKPFVCVVDNGLVLGPYAAGKTPHGKAIEETLGKPIRHGEQFLPLRSTMWAELKSRATVDQPRPVPQFDTAAVIRGSRGEEGFFHWLVDYLPKLRAVEFYENETGDDVTLIVPERIPRYADEAFDLLGFENHSLVEWDWRETELHVDSLVVPSWPEPTPGTLRWLQNSVSCSADRFADVDWIYVSRQNASRGRKVVNFDDLVPVLNDFGVEVVKCEELSLEEQIELFRSVDGVIGPHGAGLTGMIWADDLSIVELFNGMIITPFYVLADVLGHEYRSVVCEPVVDEEERLDRDRDLLVHPDDLRELLDDQL
jgi:hypothetical protein